VEPNRNGIAGAVIGGVLGSALPGLSKFFVWVVAIIGVALLHKSFEQALESRFGVVSAIVLALVLGPFFTVLRGSLQGVFTFFYLFITVAAGYALGTLMTAPEEVDE
jgi:hypothetical protein